jgi:hypothetical protein
MGTNKLHRRDVKREKEYKTEHVQIQNITLKGLGF